MKAKRFTDEQILAVLREAEAGAKAKDLCRKHRISEPTFYTWKSKYGGMMVSDARRQRDLESENGKLKRLLVDAELDKTALKNCEAENGKPAGEARRREDIDARTRLRSDARLRAGPDLEITVSL